jgi:hypothetical protein
VACRKFMRKLLYRAVFALDVIPRYGRVWRMSEQAEIATKPYWRWMSSGMWGFNILDRFNHLDEALDLVYPEESITPKKVDEPSL